MALFVASVLLWTAVGEAAPQVVVRGQAALVIRDVHREKDTTVVSGTLRDASISKGLAGRRVRLTLEAGGRRHQRRARTTANGAFSFRVVTPKTLHKLRLDYEGGALYAATHLAPPPIDISKATVTMELRAPSSFEIEQKEQKLRLRTFAGGTQRSVEVSLHLGDGRASPLLTQRTNPKGFTSLTFPTSALGRPGNKTLTLRFSGDGELNGAEQRLVLPLLAQVSVALRSRRKRVAADAQIELEGTATDILGPVTQAPVAILAMGRHVAATTTDARGRFKIAVEAGRFPPGELDLRASITPSQTWRRAGRSTPVLVLVEPPRPIPLRLYATPAAITAALVLLLLAGRWLPRLRRRDGPAARPGPETMSNGTDAPPPPISSGLVTARGRQLRRQDLGIDGVVWDAVEQRPVARAEVLLRDADDEARRCLSGGDGSFAFEDLPAGAAALQISAPGYVPEAAAVDLPHRGALRGLRIDLVPVRIRVLECYRRAALPFLPKPRLWARWTPRDLLRFVERGRHVPAALEELTEILEESYWGPGPAPLEALGRARRLEATVRSTPEDDDSGRRAFALGSSDSPRPGRDDD